MVNHVAYVIMNSNNLLLDSKKEANENNFKDKFQEHIQPVKAVEKSSKMYSESGQSDTHIAYHLMKSKANIERVL